MSRTISDSRRHARLVGEIVERVTLILSNTTKQQILDAIEEIDREARRAWYQANKAELSKAKGKTSSGWSAVEVSNNVQPSNPREYESSSSDNL